MGHLGGRPRALTLNDILRQQELQSKKDIKKEEGYPGTNSLKTLKKLWSNRQVERIVCK